MFDLIFLILSFVVGTFCATLIVYYDKKYTDRRELREEAIKNSLQDIAECLRQMCVDK